MTRLPSFALHELGWHDFQQLCHTILRECLDQSVVSFLDNRDGGRDGAFSGTWSPTPSADLEGQFVIQCKHTSLAGTKISKSDLEDELEKVGRLVRAGRCDSYVLMTNAGLTGESEKAIAAALAEEGVRHSVILGSTWLNRTIVESSRLRRLVPRLYGLGDLTQILDDRAYRQAKAVLDAMRTDLAKLVRTMTYDRAAKALDESGFVLLLGAPATGKTTIAAQLALGAADDFDTEIVKLDSMEDLQHRWNPDERQLFWLDDAFGATQIDRSLARSWTTALPRIEGALDSGSRFVLTSRDYVFQAARPYLKPGSFPLLNESQVVVSVSDLTIAERRQILYNHLRLGRQPDDFLRAIQPYLDMAASHNGFTPELARRLGDPLFTASLVPDSEHSVDEFFEHPSEFLRDVMEGLDEGARAALGLIFVNRNWLRSPIHLSESDMDLLARLGSDIGCVTQALGALNGSLVQITQREGESGWVFAHPTMVDAYADLLRSPELLSHFIAGFPIDVLFAQITCGDVGVQGAIIVSSAHYDVVVDRLDEPIDVEGSSSTWFSRNGRGAFLSSRCDREFLQRWLDRDPNRLGYYRHPGLMLTADPDNEVVARLNELTLYPESMRVKFAEEMVEYCLEGIDPSVVTTNVLRSILSRDEETALLEMIRSEVLSNLSDFVYSIGSNWTDGSPRDNPADAIEPFVEMAIRVRSDLSDDDFVARSTTRLEELLSEWAAEQEWQAPDQRNPSSMSEASAGHSQRSQAEERSIFDDLVEGR